MSAAFQRGWRKGARTVAQVVAGGALTALVTALVGGMPPAIQGVVMGAWVALVAFAQNWAETAGKIGEFLPTPSLVVGPTSDAVATVEAAADETGEIAGDVVDTAGEVVGSVTGQLTDDHEHGVGGVIVMLIIAFLIVVGLFVTCDALINDESEPGDNHLFRRVELIIR